MILKLVILCLVVLPIGWAGEAFLHKKYNIEKRRGLRYLWVNKVQTGIEIALFVVYLVGTWFAMDYIFLYIIGFFTILNLFRAFMHWKYEPEKKHHILYLYELVMLLIIWVVAYWWIFS